MNPKIINKLERNILGIPLRFPMRLISTISNNPDANIMDHTAVPEVKFFLKYITKLLTISFSSSLTIFIMTEYRAIADEPIVIIGMQKIKNKKFKIIISTTFDKNLNNGPSKLNN